MKETHKDNDYMLDILPGIASSIFAVLYLCQVPKIRVFKGLGSTPLTNHFVPNLWGGLLLFLGVVLIIRGLIKMRRCRRTSTLPKKTNIGALISSKREVIASFLSLAIYVGLLEKVGFMIMTTIYTFVQILILTPPGKAWKRNIIPAGIVAGLSGVVLYYIFKVKLNVLLPAGLLESVGETVEEVATVAQ